VLANKLWFLAKAEYKDVSNATTEITWVSPCFKNWEFLSFQPPVLWCDNIIATYLSSNLVFHAQTKHIEVDYHFGEGMSYTEASSN
jgi:hypothetical protein